MLCERIMRTHENPVPYPFVILVQKPVACNWCVMRTRGKQTNKQNKTKTCCIDVSCVPVRTPMPFRCVVRTRGETHNLSLCHAYSWKNPYYTDISWVFVKKPIPYRYVKRTCRKANAMSKWTCIEKKKKSHAISMPVFVHVENSMLYRCVTMHNDTRGKMLLHVSMRSLKYQGDWLQCS